MARAFIDTLGQLFGAVSSPWGKRSRAADDQPQPSTAPGDREPHKRARLEQDDAARAAAAPPARTGQTIPKAQPAGRVAQAKQPVAPPSSIAPIAPVIWQAPQRSPLARLRASGSAAGTDRRMPAPPPPLQQQQQQQQQHGRFQHTSNSFHRFNQGAPLNRVLAAQPGGPQATPARSMAQPQAHSFGSRLPLGGGNTPLYHFSTPAQQVQQRAAGASLLYGSNAAAADHGQQPQQLRSQQQQPRQQQAGPSAAAPAAAAAARPAAAAEPGGLGSFEAMMDELQQRPYDLMSQAAAEEESILQRQRKADADKERFKHLAAEAEARSQELLRRQRLVHIGDYVAAAGRVAPLIALDQQRKKEAAARGGEQRQQQQQQQQRQQQQEVEQPVAGPSTSAAQRQAAPARRANGAAASRGRPGKQAATEVDENVVDLLSDDEDEAAPAAAAPRQWGVRQPAPGPVVAGDELPGLLDEDGVLEEGEEEEEEQEEEVSGVAASSAEGLSEALSDVSLGAAPGRNWTPTAEEQEQYQHALTGGSETEMLASHQTSGIDLRRQDFQCMKRGEWLNDEAINMYMALLQDRDTRRRAVEGAFRCHFFSSFFLSKLYKDAGQYNYANVKRWTTEKRLKRGGQQSKCVLDLDRIIVPVNENNTHWTCALIDLKARELVYLDSFHGSNDVLLNHLAHWVVDEAKDKKGEVWDTSSWPRKSRRDVPRQTNGYDCGVFACLFAEALSLGRAWDFRQPDLEVNARVKVTCQLLDQRVE